jgi:hypothetical protein
VLRRAAGADWIVRAIDLRTAMPDDRPVRSRGVAIAGRGSPPSNAWLLTDAPLPERTLFVKLQLDGLELTAGAYHAPPGVTWGIVKPRQALGFATWLASHAGPLLFVADANTPLIDAFDFADSRTHWHTGNRQLHGEPGDDLMLGPGKIHSLDDALRRWLADHREAAEVLRVKGEHEPLAVTHHTGRRKNFAGTGRRFDSIWVSQHLTVRHVMHPYDDGIAAGSDHAPVVADLAPDVRPTAQEHGSTGTTASYDDPVRATQTLDLKNWISPT